MGKEGNPGIDDWVDMLLADHTDGTMGKYQTWGYRFREWLDQTPVEPSPDALHAFEADLSKGEVLAGLEGEWWARARPPADGYGYRTRVQAVSAAKSYLDYVHGVRFDGRQDHNVANIVRGEPPAFDPTIASQDEVASVFDDTEECGQRSCHAATVLSYDAIMRAVEVTRVRRGDIDLGKQAVYVRAAKGSKNRWIGVSDRTAEALADYLEWAGPRLDGDGDRAFLCYSRRDDGYGPWSRTGWSYHFSMDHWRGGFHSFARHSAVTNRLNAGQALDEVSQRARHRNVTTTQQYLQFVSSEGSTPPELR